MAESPWKTVAQALLLLAAGSAVAQSPAGGELAARHNCLNCHAAERKIVGPPWRDIARRHAGNAAAAAALAAKIRAGGAGAWGAVPMPAYPHLGPDEARALATWVLTQK